MEKTLIDLYIVPEGSRSAFLERARAVQGFLKTLPGFVEGYLYEKTDGASRANFVTTAVWKDEEAYENAKKAVSGEFLKLGFDRQQFFAASGIAIERAVFERFPY